VAVQVQPVVLRGLLEERVAGLAGDREPSSPLNMQRIPEHLRHGGREPEVEVWLI
jgi:hypothetical protein